MVYVLIGDWYFDGSDFFGVYSTKDIALSSLKKLWKKITQSETEPLLIREHEGCESYGSSDESSIVFRIIPHKIDQG